jgi:hypothetical protein
MSSGESNFNGVFLHCKGELVFSHFWMQLQAPQDDVRNESNLSWQEVPLSLMS